MRGKNIKGRERTRKMEMASFDLFLFLDIVFRAE
jgi:hypothetical protein